MCHASGMCPLYLKKEFNCFIRSLKATAIDNSKSRAAFQVSTYQCYVSEKSPWRGEEGQGRYINQKATTDKGQAQKDENLKAATLRTQKGRHM